MKQVKSKTEIEWQTKYRTIAPICYLSRISIVKGTIFVK